MAFKPGGTKMKILMHVIAWAIFLGLPLHNFLRWDVPKEFLYHFYIIAATNGLIFYCNYFILIPRLFFRNRRLKYYFAALLLAASMFVVSTVSGNLVFEQARREMPRIRSERTENRGNTGERNRIEERDRHRPPSGPQRLFRLPFGPMGASNFAFTALVFTVFAFGLRAIESRVEFEERQKELEKEKLNSELAFLKNQISPHFFFNTLNNIYSLIDINTHDSKEAVLKLSRMMRYLLYESEQGETRLSSEIEFMNNFIDLMRLRISEKVQLNVSFPTDHDNIILPPLLFISVIENAFKHGISYREKSFIDIRMDVSAEMLNFICQNSLVTRPENIDSDNPGIGLENLRKRLGLLFPGKHELKIDKLQSTFRVAISIQLN